MALKVSIADGNLNAAATWGTVTNTPTIGGAVDWISIEADRFSATFTAPSASDSCVGILISFAAFALSDTGKGDWTVALQEDSGGFSDVATKTFTEAELVDRFADASSSNLDFWWYFKFAAPYQFTTVVADAYRIRVRSTSSGTANRVLKDSGGSLVAFIAVDDRTGAVANDDVLFITTDVVLNASMTLGPATETTFEMRSLENAITIVNGGTLTPSPTDDITLTLTGSIWVSPLGNLGGGVQVTTGSLTLTFSQIASTDLGIGCRDGSLVNLVGTAPTNHFSMYSSGDGTSGTPLTVSEAQSDWAVNDLLCITATNGFEESEFKYVKTKPSDTTFTLSDTPGGAESGLANTHTTDAYIVHMSRNIIVQSDDAAKYLQLDLDSDTDSSAMNNNFSRTTHRLEGVMVIYGRSGNTIEQTNLSNSVVYKGHSYFLATLDEPRTHSNLIVAANVVGTSNIGVIWTQGSNQTFSEGFIIAGKDSGMELAGSNVTLTNCRFLDNNYDGSSSGAGLLIDSAVNALTVSGCDLQGNQNAALRIRQNLTASRFTACTFGDVLDNGFDLVYSAGKFVRHSFVDCLFSSANFKSGEQDSLSGSYVSFHDLNQAAKKHFIYKPEGVIQSTGTGLDDTTVRTAGSLALRMQPENSTVGLSWKFRILARASSDVFVNGFIRRNATFSSGDITVELFLPGSTTADASVTMATTTDSWLVFNINADNTDTVDGVAEVVITAKSTTAGAYCYIDDVFNGTNVLTGLDT